MFSRAVLKKAEAVEQELSTYSGCRGRSSIRLDSQPTAGKYDDGVYGVLGRGAGVNARFAYDLLVLVHGDSRPASSVPELPTY